jgi:hypothetical protein
MPGENAAMDGLDATGISPPGSGSGLAVAGLASDSSAEACASPYAHAAA